MRATVLVFLLTACGPRVEPPAESADGAGNTTSGDSSGSIPSTNSSSSATHSTSTTSTTSDDSGPPMDAESSEGDPLADCVIPKEETASITGTIAGQQHDFRYAWFAWDGGGLCPHSLRIVVFESATDFVDNADALPNLMEVARLEINALIEPGTSVTSDHDTSSSGAASSTSSDDADTMTSDGATASSVGSGESSSTGAPPVVCAAEAAGDALTLEWTTHWRKDDAEFRSDGASAAALASDGSLVVVGVTGSPIAGDDASDAVVLKVGPTGEVLWFDIYQGEQHLRDDGVGIATTTDGTIFATVIEQTRVVHTGEYPQVDVEVVLLAYDLDGTHVWRRTVETYGARTSEWVYRAPVVAREDDGAVVILPQVVDGSGEPADVLFVTIDRWGNERSRWLYEPAAPIEDVVDAFALAGGVGLVGGMIVGDTMLVAAFDDDVSLLWSDTHELRQLSVTGGAATPDEGIIVAASYRPRAGGAPPRALLRRWNADGSVAWTRDTETDYFDSARVGMDCTGAFAVAVEQHTWLHAPDGEVLDEIEWDSRQEFEATYPAAVLMDGDGSVIVVGSDAQDGTDYDVWIQRLARPSTD